MTPTMPPSPRLPLFLADAGIFHDISSLGEHPHLWDKETPGGKLSALPSGAVGKAYVPVGAFLLPSAAGSISRARGMTPCLVEAGRAGGPRPAPEQAGLCAGQLKGALWLLWARRAPRLLHRTLFVGVTWGWGRGEARAGGVPGGLQALRHPQPHPQPYVSIAGLRNGLGGLSNTHLAKSLLITCKCVKSRRCEGFVPTSAAWFHVKPPSAAAVSFGCRGDAVNKCFGSLARKPKY